MPYRCAKDNDSTDVIAIAEDTGQSGPYSDLGVWCDFTFDEIPLVASAVYAKAEDNGYQGPLLKLVGDVVAPYSLSDVPDA